MAAERGVHGSNLTLAQCEFLGAQEMNLQGSTWPRCEYQNTNVLAKMKSNKNTKLVWRKNVHTCFLDLLTTDVMKERKSKLWLSDNAMWL